MKNSKENEVVTTDDFENELPSCDAEKKVSEEEKLEKAKKWDKRFMEMAEFIGGWSSCLKTNYPVGAVIVKDKKVLTTGYNGAPSGIKSCVERGICIRQRDNIPSKTMREHCYAVHAEQNAIAQAARFGISVEGATLYCTHAPCSICARMIINSGIRQIIYRNEHNDEFSQQLLKEAGIKIRCLPYDNKENE